MARCRGAARRPGGAAPPPPPPRTRPGGLLPSPWSVATTAAELARDGELLRHVVASLGRIAAGFAIGAVVALVLGTLVGLSRTIEALIDPTLQLLRNIPSLAWVPFLLLWL